MACIFNLDNLIVKERTRPDIIPEESMKKLIDQYFLPSDKFGLENLVGFYETSEGENLFHSALLIEKKGHIFQQSGTGGVFETKIIEEKLRSLINFKSENA